MQDREVQGFCSSASRHLLLEISPSLAVVEAKGHHCKAHLAVWVSGGSARSRVGPSSVRGQAHPAGDGRWLVEGVK